MSLVTYNQINFSWDKKNFFFFYKDLKIIFLKSNCFFFLLILHTKLIYANIYFPP